MDDLDDLVDDGWLRARFQPPQVRDEGFSNRVLHGIRVGQRRRQLAMAAVWAGGCTLALFSAGPLLADLPAYMPEVSTDWLTAVSGHVNAIGVVMLGCLSGAVVLLLED